MTNRTLFSLLGGVTLMPMMGAAQTQRPNIIIMNIDDMGYSDPSCFGGDYVNTTWKSRVYLTPEGELC